MNKMYKFSDAWFLTSLIILNKWSTIEQVISTGDMINHAIFSKLEIDNALETLIPAGLIETRKMKYRATSKTKELANCTAFRRAALFTKTDVILEQMNK